MIITTARYNEILKSLGINKEDYPDIELMRIGYSHSFQRFEFYAQHTDGYTQFIYAYSEKELLSSIRRYLNPWEEYDEWKRSTI